MYRMNMHTDQCLAHDVHESLTGDYAPLFTDQHLADAKAFKPRKLDSFDPLFRV